MKAILNIEKHTLWALHKLLNIIGKLSEPPLTPPLTPLCLNPDNVQRTIAG